MYALDYSSFKLEGREEVSNRLKRMVDALSIDKIGTGRMRKLLCLYYGSPLRYTKFLDINLELRWNAANNYQVLVNGTEQSFLDINDLYLINYLCGRGTTFGYHLRYQRANLPKLFKHLKEDFRKYLKCEYPLGLRTLRALRIHAMEYDYKLDRQVIRQSLGYKKWIFPRIEEIKYQKPNFTKDI